MSVINDGGAAYPIAAVYHPEHGVQRGDAWADCGGMSLRDHLAGQALIALGALQEEGVGPSVPIIWARSAYKLADAMLEAREQKAGGE